MTRKQLLDRDEEICRIINDSPGLSEIEYDKLIRERRSYQDIKNLAPETIRTWQDLMSGHHIEEQRRAEQENKDDC